MPVCHIISSTVCPLQLDAPWTLYPRKAYLTCPACFWLHSYRSPSAASILLHFSNTCHSGTTHCLLSLSVVLFFLIFAHVLRWAPSYFPSNHPPCILDKVLPDIFLNNLFLLSLFLSHSPFWTLSPIESRDLVCLAHHWIYSA